MTLHEIIKKDLWATAEGTFSGRPIIIEFRHELTRDCDVTEFPYLIQVNWRFEGTQPGVPKQAADDAMENFENQLVEILEKDLTGVLLASITTSDYREWVFYVKSVELFSKRFLSISQARKPFPIEIRTKRDPEWDHFFDHVQPVE